MSLVELAVGVACRSSVKAYCDSTPQDSTQPSMWQQLLEFGTLPKGEKMFAACVGTFVREGTKASFLCFRLHLQNKGCNLQCEDATAFSTGGAIALEIKAAYLQVEAGRFGNADTSQVQHEI